MRVLHAVVLASASPRRLELLRSLGLQVTVAPSGYGEGDRPGLDPLQLAILHAEAKADASISRSQDRLIVTADTVVDVDGSALGKPQDDREAAAMLTALSGREHLVHTAFTLADPPSGRRLQRSVTTRVRFHALTPAEIQTYIASGEPFDKAGGYGVQGRGAALVERIDGDFYTVMGFPLGEFVRSLPELDYELAPLAKAGAR